MKIKRAWFRKLFRRRVFAALLIAAQVALLGYIILSASYGIHTLLSAISLLVALFMFRTEKHPSYKLTWVFLILLFPLFGGLFYLLYAIQKSTRAMRAQLRLVDALCRPLFVTGQPDLGPEIEEKHPDYLIHSRYLAAVGYPVFDRTRTEYLPTGEQFFARITEEIKKAEKYILLEFFIISEGIMWNSILDLLEQKVKDGVEVRLMYDDMGCFLTLPSDYAKRLEQKGIKCCVFNPFNPVLSSLQNNRDHRKILSVDGKVAFTGGINLADEYINAYEKHGHWRDCGILLEGEAAWSLTLIFLQLWNISKKTAEDLSVFYPWKEKPCPIYTDGFVQPYADSPLDNENIGEQVYLQMINAAKRTLYINTPYFIIGDNLLSALTLAAKRGVDIRIITPQIADKPLIHTATRSYYPELIQAGIKVYEYTGGFNHAKTFVVDDSLGVVGTVNLDFRSIYLHFECGVCLYGTGSIASLKQDFLRTLERCTPITAEGRPRNIFKQLFEVVLRLFSPLL